MIKHSRRRFLKSMGILLAGSTLPGCLHSKQSLTSKPPNIIFIMLDELGYFELSCMGNDKLQTPNIDRLAAQGMRFTQLLAGSCVCAPTRSVLMTGKHAGHTTVRQNQGGLALTAEDVTIAQVLKQAGYATGGFGKWGLGDVGTPGVPETHGFDIFYGYYHQVHAHSYYPRYLLRNSQKEYLPGNTGDFYDGKTFAHDSIYREAIKFIRQNKDQPFFCYCPWTPPHGLWGFPQDDPAWTQYKDKPWTAGQRKATDSRVYAAMVSMVDRQVGEILDLLNELKIDNNTMIFFCGDNGGQPYFYRGDPDHPQKENPPYTHGFFGPNLNPKTGQRFRGGKGNLYEGGLRIPFIAHWPGKISPNSVTDHLCYFPDIMPTLAECAHVEPPESTDGFSLVPTLLNDTSAPQKKHTYLYWEYGKQVAVRMGHYKAVRPGTNRPFELYNLAEDVEEKTNIADQHPDILQQMELYAKQAHNDTVPGTYLPGQKHLGFKGHNHD